MTKETAIKLLNQNVSSQNLVRHCLAVGYSLGAIYDYLKTNPSTGSGWKNDSPDNKEVWEILGFLHDSDWELTKDTIDRHTLLLLDWLEKEGVKKTDPIYLAIQSHNNKVTKLREPQTQMEWALECVDELTGFIVAVAMVKGKSLQNVEVASIKKRFKEKAFAAAVNRQQITQVAEKINIPVDVFVEITLNAMKNNAQELGL